MPRRANRLPAVPVIRAANPLRITLALCNAYGVGRACELGFRLESGAAAGVGVQVPAVAAGLQIYGRGRVDVGDAQWAEVWPGELVHSIVFDHHRAAHGREVNAVPHARDRVG